MQSQLVTQRLPEGLEIYTAYADREGNYWFGTWLNGLFRARRQAVIPYTKAQGLMASEVYPILEDRAGTIWIGSIGDGLFRFQNGAFSQLVGSTSAVSYSTSLFEDRAGRIWANGRQLFVDGRLVPGATEEVLTPEVGNCWTGERLRPDHARNQQFIGLSLRGFESEDPACGGDRYSHYPDDLEG